MSDLTIQDYHGAVTKCHCSNSDAQTPMPCNECFCRGYVAACLACKGEGQVIVPVAGGSGDMKSTCSVCGGKGKFGVNKPKDWDILHPVEVEEAAAEEKLEGESELEPEVEVASVG